MKRVIVTGILVMLCFLLQTSVCPWISFGGIIPNLLIILTASFGFMHGEVTGMVTGFACGFLLDVFTAYGGGTGNGDMLGFFALMYLVCGYLNGKCHQMFYPEDIKFPLMMIILSDLTFNFACYIVMFLFRARMDLQYYLLHIILPEAVYTIIVAFAFYPLFLWINGRLEKAERGSTE